MLIFSFSFFFSISRLIPLFTFYRCWPRPPRWSPWCWWGRLCPGRPMNSTSTWQPSWSLWACPCSCWRARMPPSTATASPPPLASACWWAICCSTASPPTGRGSSSPSTRCPPSRWWQESTSSPASSPPCHWWSRAASLSRQPSCCATQTLWSTRSSSASAQPQGSCSFFTPLLSSGPSASSSSWPCGKASPSSSPASSTAIRSPSSGCWAFW